MSISTAESEAVDGCAPSLPAQGRVPDICLATICRSSACNPHQRSAQGTRPAFTAARTHPIFGCSAPAQSKLACSHAREHLVVGF